MARILLVEPFYGGSHRQLIDTLIDGLLNEESAGSPTYELYTLPAKKWHWRARTSALYFAEQIPRQHQYRVLFASSVLNLAELLGLRPDLVGTKKILYFHENQLVYPVRKQQDRDFQYGYNQIVSCLAADVVAFNSKFNMDSFLGSIQSFFKLQPDNRPKDLAVKLSCKCSVLHFPVKVPIPMRNEARNSQFLHIVWPHRWEHDKGPEIFFRVLDSLIEKKCRFRLSVLGEQFTEAPPIFAEAKDRYETSQCCVILDWGFVPRQRFVEILSAADVVVSTALHEFYGVSMIEAALSGCYPLCPNRLSYPEIFPEQCLYNTEAQLAKKLKQFCQHPATASARNLGLDLSKYTWTPPLKSQYRRLLFD